MLPHDQRRSRAEKEGIASNSSKMDIDPSNNSMTTPKNANDSNGILRYFPVINNKRKRSGFEIENNCETHLPKANSQKISTQKQSTSTIATVPVKNRFDVLQTESNEERKIPKPPPVYIRERSTNFSKEIKQFLKKEYYLVDLKRGQLHETKIQVSDPVEYTTLVKWLEEKKLEFYSYQPKAEKGIRVVIKGIDHTVDPQEVKEDLEKLNFKVNWVHNIQNKFRQPQPMFKVELMPNSSILGKNKVHPIYDIKFILHRRVTIEEPYKRSGPIQCLNCQEFGHTRTYCRLKSVCVVCGGNHTSDNCQAKNDTNIPKKCGNCGESHTANYRGCPVYKSLNKKKSTFDQQPVETNSVSGTMINKPYQSNFRDERSFADIVRGNTSVQQTTNNDSTTQILIALMNSIQQLTSSLVQMQKMQMEQLEILKQLKP